jgi:hypothetical protein
LFADDRAIRTDAGQLVAILTPGQRCADFVSGSSRLWPPGNGEPLSLGRLIRAHVTELISNQISDALTVGAPTGCSEAYAGDFRSLQVGLRTTFRIAASREAAGTSSSAFGNMLARAPWISTAFSLQCVPRILPRCREGDCRMAINVVTFSRIAHNVAAILTALVWILLGLAWAKKLRWRTTASGPADRRRKLMVPIAYWTLGLVELFDSLYELLRQHR